MQTKPDAEAMDMEISSDAGAAQKLPAPKQCEVPRLARPAPDNPQLATDITVVLVLKKPASVTAISRFEVELYDELSHKKTSEKIENAELWTTLADADGSFEYALQQPLHAGKGYRVQVFAVGTGATQNGMRSKKFTFCTPKPRPPPPECPEKPEADDVKQTEFVLTFKLPVSVAPITQVEVLFREDNDLFQDAEDWDQFNLLSVWKDSPAGTSFIDTLESLDPGTRYVVKWRVQSEEWSAYSEELSVKTKPAEPSAPTQSSALPAGPATSVSPTTPAAPAAPKVYPNSNPNPRGLP
jgi:hypothetical protein